MLLAPQINETLSNQSNLLCKITYGLLLLINTTFQVFGIE